MKKFQSFFFFFLLIAGVATLSCYLTGYLIRTSKKINEGHAHSWIHKQLDLSHEQEKLLHSAESRFIEKKTLYTEQIRSANTELARAMLQDKGYSNEVTAAVEKIHQSQGELQKATLEHVFEMKDALTPEQYQKLIELTANALYQIDRDP